MFINISTAVIKSTKNQEIKIIFVDQLTSQGKCQISTLTAVSRTKIRIWTELSDRRTLKISRVSGRLCPISISISKPQN